MTRAWYKYWAQLGLGDIRLDRGNLPEALKSYRDGLAIADRLAKADPGNAGWQRDLSVSYNKIGDVLVAQGNLPEALKSYRDGLAIVDRLAKADPGNAGWQRDLSVSLREDRRRAGGAGQPAGGAEILSRRPRDRRAAGQGRPGNAGWQRDLSVSYNKIGDVLVAQGNLPEALKSYRDGLAIGERLAKADPGNAGWQRDLSVSYNKVGDVLVAQGNLPEALKSYRDSLAISERLAKADPGNAGWQRDLSVSLRQGRRRAGGAGQPAGGAEILPRRPRDRRAAGEGRPRQRRLAARSVGVLRQGRRRAGGAGQPAGGAEILPRRPRHRERLAKADPGNAGWQRDLSVSYDKVGDVLVAQGNLPEALKSYRDGLAIGERLAKADPGNAGWQRDLSVSLRQGRRRAGGAGQPAGGAEILPRRPRHRESGWPRPTPATPAGSAICRCPTTRSATCWWRRAICPRR